MERCERDNEQLARLREMHWLFENVGSDQDGARQKLKIVEPSKVPTRDELRDPLGLTEDLGRQPGAEGARTGESRSSGSVGEAIVSSSVTLVMATHRKRLQPSPRIRHHATDRERAEPGVS